MEGEVEDEDLIQREDMRRHRQPQGLHQARAAVDLSRPAPRRQGPLRHVDARGGCRHPLFVASTHTPVLFFSSRGMGYRMKVWRLPLAAPQARGKALVNLLPLDEGRGHHLDPAAARG